MQPFWTLDRDDAGFYLRYDNGTIQRIDSAGVTLSVSWCLGLPGPLTMGDAQKLLENPERSEGASIDFLASKVGERGPSGDWIRGLK